MAYSTISHKRALHNYFILCLNHQKTYGNFGKGSEISANFRKLKKSFEPVFDKLKCFMKRLENFGNGSKNIFRYFYDFLKFSENLQKSSEMLGNLRKLSENFGNGSKVIFRCFYNFKNFSKIFGSLQKCSEIFGNFRKTLETVQK